MKMPLIEIGFDKNGEIDFGVLCSVKHITPLQRSQVRAMICVSISHCENWWREEDEERNPASKEVPSNE